MYHTGDTAWRDEDGYIYYVSRIDDVIKSSGYRIGPFDIASVIMELPYVVECGVSAVPDPVRGQVVKASIVLTKGTEGTEELKKEIHALRDELSALKEKYNTTEGAYQWQCKEADKYKALYESLTLNESVAE